MSDPTPLLFLPGLLCDGALWENQVRHLADVAESRVADLTGADSVEALATAALATASSRADAG